MKNKSFIIFTAVFISIILYGLFSLYIALNVLWQPHQADSIASPGYEVITTNGNKIVYYNI